MDQARFLQRVRMNQFKKVYDRWKQKKLTQKEAAEQLGTFYFLSSKNFGDYIQSYQTLRF